MIYMICIDYQMISNLWDRFIEHVSYTLVNNKALILNYLEENKDKGKTKITNPNAICFDLNSNSGPMERAISTFQFTPSSKYQNKISYKDFAEKEASEYVDKRSCIRNIYEKSAYAIRQHAEKILSRCFSCCAPIVLSEIVQEHAEKGIQDCLITYSLAAFVAKVKKRMMSNIAVRKYAIIAGILVYSIKENDWIFPLKKQSQKGLVYLEKASDRHELEEIMDLASHGFAYAMLEKRIIVDDTASEVKIVEDDVKSAKDAMAQIMVTFQEAAVTQLLSKVPPEITCSVFVNGGDNIFSLFKSNNVKIATKKASATKRNSVEYSEEFLEAEDNSSVRAAKKKTKTQPAIAEEEPVVLQSNSISNHPLPVPNIAALAKPGISASDESDKQIGTYEEMEQEFNNQLALTPTLKAFRNSYLPVSTSSSAEFLNHSTLEVRHIQSLNVQSYKHTYDIFKAVPSCLDYSNAYFQFFFDNDVQIHHQEQDVPPSNNVVDEEQVVMLQKSLISNINQALQKHAELKAREPISHVNAQSFPEDDESASRTPFGVQHNLTVAQCNFLPPTIPMSLIAITSPILSKRIEEVDINDTCFLYFKSKASSYYEVLKDEKICSPFQLVLNQIYNFYYSLTISSAQSTANCIRDLQVRNYLAFYKCIQKYLNPMEKDCVDARDLHLLKTYESALSKNPENFIIVATVFLLIFVLFYCINR